jgi:cytochrome b involved in lipid metabolism
MVDRVFYKLFCTGGKKVYDVSNYLNDHPGGAQIMLDHGGKDADAMFEDVGHSGSARAKKKTFCIGILQGGSSTSADGGTVAAGGEAKDDSNCLIS